MSKDNIEQTVNELIDKTFEHTQQNYLNSLGNVVDNQKLQFNQDQIDVLMSIIEASSKRSAKIGALIAIEAIQRNQ